MQYQTSIFLALLNMVQQKLRDYDKLKIRWSEMRIIDDA